ncbi:MAG: DUF29 family protein, partial [Methylobacter sp.]
ARVRVSRETGLDESAFPSECPWTIEQIIDHDFFPDGD